MWTQDAGNPQRTGYGAEEPTEPWTLLWSFNGPDPAGGTGGHFYDIGISSAFTPIWEGRTVMGPANIYVPALAYGLYALEKWTGVVRWNFRPGASFKSTPAYNPATNTVLAGDDNGVVYKLNADTGGVLGTYQTGSPISKALLIVGAYVYAVTDSGQLHKIDIVSMTRVWLYSGFSSGATPPAYSATRDLLVYATGDLYVHGVANSNGIVKWRVKPSPLSPSQFTTFEGYWPVIAEQHGIVFLRMNVWSGVSGDTQMFTGPGYAGKYPNTNAETRAFLIANPDRKNLFALSLDTGVEAFIPAVGPGSTEGTLGGTYAFFTGPIPVVKVLPDGKEVAYCQFRNGQTADIGFPWDFRWDSHLGEMVLDGSTVPGYTAGDLRFIQFSNSYVHITDEQNPYSMAGDTFFYGHWGANESTKVLDRSATRGNSLTNPITSQAHPPLSRGIACRLDDYNPVTHWTSVDWFCLYNDGRAWDGPGWWTYWNTAMPLSPLSGTYSVGLGPRYTYVSDGLIVTEGSGGELLVFKHSGVVTDPPVPSQIALSHVGSPSNPVGTQHTVQALVLDQYGQPMMGVSVELQSTISQPAGVVTNLTDNLAGYPGGQVPRYAKLELTFDVDTPAPNPQFPYDPTPPPGVPAGVGVSVDGFFSNDNWTSFFIVPGFLYQGYTRELHSGWEILYPSGKPVWKVRFAPPAAGTWKYHIRVIDARGTFLYPASGDLSFSCAPSTSKGFVRVSPADPRYFEMSDGSPLVLAGTNEGLDEARMTYDLDQKLAVWMPNGLNFFRIWMSGSSIVSSAWIPWRMPGVPYDGYIPPVALTAESPYTGMFSTKLTGSQVIFQQGVPVRPSTTYQVRVRLRTVGITGPVTVGQPYGLVVQASQGGAETIIIPHINGDRPWQIVSGTYTSGAGQYFIGWFTLAMENATGGAAYIDTISIREDLGGGNLGPEMLRKGDPNYHLYFDQVRSWDWDYILDRCAEAGVYLKLVTLEKNEWIYNRINANGQFTTAWDNNNFYAAPNRAVRRLHEYFWRYLAARWGYSTAVHSWELLNEGDPFNGNHYAQAESFAAGMHLLEPGRHLVTTSNWHSYPASEFWGNPLYPNVDYGDLHAYISTGGINVIQPEGRLDYDTALYVDAYARKYGAYGPQGAGKPLVRGEAGIDDGVAELPGLANDTQGVWLHNYVWGQIGPGGIYELYWWLDNIRTYNLWPTFRPFRSFLEGIPLNNGRYVDAAVVTSDPNLRAWGQVDVLSGKAHLWIANKGHTWKNVVDGVAIPPVGGTVTIPSLPVGTYAVEWWDTYAGVVASTQNVATAGGGLTLALLQAITTDLAVKVSRQ